MEGGESGLALLVKCRKARSILVDIVSAKKECGMTGAKGAQGGW